MRALGRDRGCERSYPSSKPAISLSVEGLKFLGMFSSGSCKQTLYVCALYRSQMCRQSMLRSHVDSPCQVLMSEVAGRMHKKPTLHTAAVMWARGQHCTYIANIVYTKTSPLTFARPTLNTQVQHCTDRHVLLLLSTSASTLGSLLVQYSQRGRQNAGFWNLGIVPHNFEIECIEKRLGEN